MRLAACVLALTTLLAGCSNDKNVLAKVNGKAITVDKFNDAARSAMTQYPGPPDSVKIHLLKDLVDRELMVQGAVKAGLRETPEYKAFAAQLERQVLRETLLKRLMGGPFPVSDAEAKELYDRRGVSTHARIIFCFDEKSAREAAKALAGGEDFTAVAQRFNPTGMIPPGGDIGFVQAGALLPPLDEVVRTGALHEVHGPLQGGGQGWFLIRLEERKTSPQPPFDQIKDQVSEMVRQRKQQAAGMKAVDGLRADYDVKVEPGAAQAVAERFRQSGAAGPQATPSAQNSPGAPALPPLPPAPGAEERKKAIAHYRGGEYTLGEAYDDLTNPGGNRPNFAVIPTVDRWIESQVLERAAQAEARKRHLNEEPEVKTRIEEQLNNFMLDGYYQRAVASRIHVEPSDIAAAYEMHKASFARLQSARVASVTMRDSAGAAALAEQAAHAPNLPEAAAAAGGRARQESLKFPASTPVWTQLEGRMMSMNVGDIAGPYHTPAGWLVFQLMDKQQNAPTFDTLPANARLQLQSAATEMKREARLAALTDSLRKAIHVEIHEDRLSALPWPPPVAPPGT